MTYMAIIEESTNGFTAYSPDIPLFSVRGGTEEQAIEALRKELKAHINQLKAAAAELPQRVCKAELIKVTE